MEKSSTTTSLQKIEEAAKTIRNQKTKPNMMLVSLSWSIQLLLPYEDGLALMATLKNAEQFTDTSSSGPKILPLDKESIRGNVFSHQKYEDVKVANLLNITLEELYEAREPQTQPV